MKKLQQLQYKILLVTILCVLSMVIILVSNYKINSLNKRKEKTFETLTEISHFMVEVNGLEKDFFNYEIINPEFHNSGRSKVLKNCNITFKNLEFKLKEFTQGLSQKDKTTISPLIIQLSKKIEYHSLLYDSLSLAVRSKGFHDYGLIGKMRKEAHFIENHAPFSNKEEILMLRRHEKDYFLRKQDKYIVKAFYQIDVLSRKIDSLKIDKRQKNIFKESISNYANYLRAITEYNIVIGIKAEDGLKGSINRNFVTINKHIELIKKVFKKNTDSRIGIINVLNLIALCILIFVITISLFTSKKLGFPIQKLSNSIRHSIENNFDEKYEIEVSNSKDEIGQLSLDVEQMLKKIISSKKELLYKREEIQNQHLKLKEKKADLETAFKIIEDKNNNLTSSITYAKRIQDAMFMGQDDVGKMFPNHFTLYKPRDIVSGDFYMVYKKENVKIIVAVDCTGHGVPGAFMTLLATMVISDYINNCSFKKNRDQPFEGEMSPKNMLEQLDVKIRKVLNQEKTMIRDGMDMAVCMIDEDTKRLRFAGAKMPLYIYQNNELLKIKGSKRCIGGLLDDKVAGIDYQEHVFDLFSKTRFYMLSDGYQDQFGGIEDTKFRSKRIESMILETTDVSIKEQKQIFEKALHNWMNPPGYQSYNQIDDIMVLGFEV